MTSLLIKSPYHSHRPCSSPFLSFFHVISSLSFFYSTRKHIAHPHPALLLHMYFSSKPLRSLKSWESDNQPNPFHQVFLSEACFESWTLGLERETNMRIAQRNAPQSGLSLLGRTLSPLMRGSERVERVEVEGFLEEGGGLYK